MLAGAECPGAGHADCDAEGVAWEDFDLRFGAFASDISSEETDKTECSLFLLAKSELDFDWTYLERPESNDAVHHELLGSAFEMDEDSSHCSGGS